MRSPHEQTPDHIGRNIRHFPSIASTNAFAATLADDPAHHGTVILADEQTEGRGQYGRRWQAPPRSSVLMSVVLFPPPHLRRPVLLTAWAAAAVSETILRITGWQAKIKWPNDLLLLDRKVCGILIEQTQGIVAGIGLNVAQSADDFHLAGLESAGSLQSVIGRPFDPKAIAESLIQQLDRDYAALFRGEIAALESVWNWRLDLLGKYVIAEENDGSKHRGWLRDLGFEAVILEEGGRYKRLVPEMIRRLAEA